MSRHRKRRRTLFVSNPEPPPAAPVPDPPAQPLVLPPDDAARLLQECARRLGISLEPPKAHPAPEPPREEPPHIRDWIEALWLNAQAVESGSHNA